MVSCRFCIEISALRRDSDADWMDSVRSSPDRPRMMSSFATSEPSCTLMDVTVPAACAVRVRSA